MLISPESSGLLALYFGQVQSVNQKTAEEWVSEWVWERERKRSIEGETERGWGRKKVRKNWDMFSLDWAGFNQCLNRFMEIFLQFWFYAMHAKQANIIISSIKDWTSKKVAFFVDDLFLSANRISSRNGRQLQLFLSHERTHTHTHAQALSYKRFYGMRRCFMCFWTICLPDCVPMILMSPLYSLLLLLFLFFFFSFFLSVI